MTTPTLPVVAIVGQPNVGKSTLFNCLTASRAAIISNYPGLTRDRQYGEARFENHPYIVIDTGGLTEENDPINQLTRKQALQAITEADHVLFVVNARTGCTALDLSIAQTLRSLHKKIIVVVNKSEGMDTSIAITDFFQLGFGEPIPIAAEHRLGITQLLQFVFKDQPPFIQPVYDNNIIQLAIIGRPNVGKSTLLNRMLGEERVIVYDQPGTTRDSIAVSIERQGQQYTVIDTAGIRKRGKIIEAIEKFSIVKTLQAIESAHVVLFVLDATEGVTEQDCHLLGFILDNGKSLVIAINKWDGLTTDQREKVHASIDRRFRFLPFIRQHCISALHGSGVGNLFPSINEAYASAHQAMTTHHLSDLLEKAVNTHQPPLIKGRRVKLRYAHVGGQNPPTVVIHGNQVHSLPKSYIRYLTNTYQKELDLIGTPIRIELRNSQNPYENRKKQTTKKINRKKNQRAKRIVKKN